MNISTEALFDVTAHEDIHTIHLSPAIRERDRVADFREQLLAFLEDQKPRKVQVNFASAGFFSSEAISALVEGQKRLKETGGRMVLSGMSSDLRNVFEICRLNAKVFEIYDLYTEATAALMD
ncbi:MAG: STAS domain-containing protein [Planctomycetota bacterium]